MSKPQSSHQLSAKKQLELNLKLMRAVQDENPDIVLCENLLLEGANPNFNDGESSVLNRAIIMGDQNVEVVELLLFNKAKPAPIPQTTIQHIAASMGSVKILEALNRREVDVFVVDADGKTPLARVMEECGLDLGVSIEDMIQKQAPESYINVIKCLRDIQAQKSGSAVAASSSSMSDRALIEQLQREHLSQSRVIPSNSYVDMPKRGEERDRTDSPTTDSPSKRIAPAELETLRRIERMYKGDRE